MTNDEGWDRVHSTTEPVRKPLVSDIRTILRDMRTPLALQAADQIDSLVSALVRIREYPYIVGGEDAAPEMAAIAAKALSDTSQLRTQGE